jgi:hypothetical protein
MIAEENFRWPRFSSAKLTNVRRPACSVAPNATGVAWRQKREILSDALRKEENPKRGLGSEMVALFSGQGIGLKKGEEIPEIRGMRMQIPKFEP